LKIVSGGQTGADRAALDFAIACEIPHGGWCPAGRKAEDGILDRRYQLKETPSADYDQRTDWNVKDSDGTVIFSTADILTGGSKRTAQFAKKHNKPVLHLYAAKNRENAADQLLRFLEEHSVGVLNIAGPRASEEPGVGEFVTAVLDQALRPRSIFIVDHSEVLASYELALGLSQRSSPKLRLWAFTDPEVALGMFASARPKPDLLITSYLLHSLDGVSMNGLQLLDRCRRIEPGLKVLLTSSVPFREVQAALQKTSVRPDAFIKKPFELKELAQIIRDALGLIPSSTCPF
jgi:CheY-like chemotaxis protein